ncbi:hypothetical protein Bca101_093215 [Brassica carinata]
MLGYSRFFPSCRVYASLNFNWAFVDLSPNFCRSIRNSHLIRAPHSVFLLGRDLHNEIPQKLRVTIQST